MRGRIAWVVGLVAAALVALRALGRRQTHGAWDEPVPEPDEPVLEPPDARAEELRRRLAEARELVEERAAFEEGEVPVDRAEAGDDPDARRRHVHDEGRAAVEEMRRTGES